jgi:hypothetical protein
VTRKGRKWPGQLGKPIYPALTPDVLEYLRMKHKTGEARKRIVEHARKEIIHRAYLHKLKLLLDHYAIDRSSPAAYLELSLKLAIDLRIPGFALADAPTKRVGRPQTWSTGQDKIFVAEVRMIQVSKKCSTIEAIRHLKRTAWKRYGRYSLQGLKTRYYEARRLHTSTRLLSSTEK